MKITAAALGAFILLAACGSDDAAGNAADQLDNAAEQSDPAAEPALEDAADALRDADGLNAAEANAVAQDALGDAGNAQAPAE